MALLLKKMYQGYFWIFHELSDPRASFTIFSSPIAMIITIVGYLYIVKQLGPKFMENRKPYDVKNIMIVYNIIQIILNAYLFYKIIRYLWRLKSWECVELDYSNSPEGLEALYLTYSFVLLKILDFVDTFFFVLRKSYRQISFLHVYHHSMIILVVWIGLVFLPGGESLWIGAINCFIHTCMFSYYFLTAINSDWKNVFWMKRAVTQVQLIQFLFFSYHYGRLVFNNKGCYPRILSFLLVSQNVFMITLFGDFYYKNYIKKNTQVHDLNKKL